MDCPRGCGQVATTTTTGPATTVLSCGHQFPPDVLAITVTESRNGRQNTRIRLSE